MTDTPHTVDKELLSLLLLFTRKKLTEINPNNNFCG